MQEYTSDPLVGNLVDGRYLVQSRLASGGMSTVYLATDRRLERDVALKVLHPHMAGDPQFLDRLGREAKAAARLSHPHVVGVLDQGEDGRIGLPGDGVHQGPHTAGRPQGKGRPAAAACPGADRSGCRRAGSGPRRRPDPPGHQARKRPDRRRRADQARRLRAGPRHLDVDQHRRPDRDGRLPLPRTCPGQAG